MCHARMYPAVRDGKSLFQHITTENLYKLMTIVNVIYECSLEMLRNGVANRSPDGHAPQSSNALQSSHLKQGAESRKGNTTSERLALKNILI